MRVKKQFRIGLSVVEHESGTNISHDRELTDEDIEVLRTLVNLHDQGKERDR
jgi:hypothetical protein